MMQVYNKIIKNIIYLAVCIFVVVTAPTSSANGKFGAYKGKYFSHGHFKRIDYPGRKKNGKRHRKIRPIYDSDFPETDEAKEALGKFLFFDKILSGNKNISCATCHHPLAATGDGLSLPLGEGGIGLGVTRNTGSEQDAVHERVPRNAPHLFNIGAIELERMFHDGRVEKNDDNEIGFDSPAGDLLLPGLESALAVQAMFPVTSAAEMAGQRGENEIADAAAANDFQELWRLITERLMGIEAYRNLFLDAYPELTSSEEVTFAHAANAIAAFEAAAFRADDSPFDRFLRGDRSAMSTKAKKGWKLFKGKANCISCHRGKFLSDHDFHALCIPQIGPGKGDGFKGHDDFGRERVTGDVSDRYKFRTPPLRNVALTGPWGHDGAYNTLEAVVRHHLDAVNGLTGYDRRQAVLPSRTDLDALDFIVFDDEATRQTMINFLDIAPVRLRRREFKNLIEFLHALTDRQSLDLRSTAPTRVPSGLPLAE